MKPDRLRLKLSPVWSERTQVAGAGAGGVRTPETDACKFYGCVALFLNMLEAFDFVRNSSVVNFDKPNTTCTAHGTIAVLILASVICQVQIFAQ